MCEVVSLVYCPHRVGNAVDEHRMHLELYVVPCDDRLQGKVHNLLSQVDAVALHLLNLYGLDVLVVPSNARMRVI